MDSIINCTSLGLAITHVELHGGKLRIDRELGAGTTVQVYFPGDRLRAMDISS